MNWTRHFDYPPMWVMGFMALIWGLSNLWSPLGDWGKWPGYGMMAAALGVVVWSGIQFRRARTTVIPHRAPKALVDTGPYQYSRNPIYLADLVLVAGWCLVCGTPMALLLVPALATVLLGRFILPEEDRLNRHLGEVYVAYCARVRRWF